MIATAQAFAANLLVLDLPVAEVAGDLSGLRLHTPELVRRNVGADNVGKVAALFASDVRALRAHYQSLHL